MEKTRLTQRDFYNELIDLALDNGREDLADFCKGRIALLNKKAENKKPNKKQEENEGVKTEILDTISDKALTVSEIVKAMTTEVSSQKVTALLTQLINDKKVVRTVEKKVARFSVAQ